MTPAANTTPDFRQGMLHFGSLPAEAADLTARPAIAEGETGISEIDAAAVYQTQLIADGLRYATLQLCASKESGHPGGFASSADAYAALTMLGHTNIVTEVGHHAPGFYAAMFLDSSLEAMGIYTMDDLQTRFRERDGLLGHLSGAIPGLLAPAGPLGQGQHFAMAGAYLNRDRLFPCTIGDGGLGEPYILSAMKHFHTSYPEVTNFLPVLVWNGFSQEHHSMVSLMDNARMTAYWQAHDFERVILIDAKDYDDSGQSGAYVDSTRFGPEARHRLHPGGARGRQVGGRLGHVRDPHGVDHQAAQGRRRARHRGQVSQPLSRRQPRPSPTSPPPWSGAHSPRRPGPWCAPICPAPAAVRRARRW